jgi:hypothetical protein
MVRNAVVLIAILVCVSIWIGWPVDSARSGPTPVADAEAMDMIGAASLCATCDGTMTICPQRAQVGSGSYCYMQQMNCHLHAGEGYVGTGCSEPAQQFRECQWAVQFWCGDSFTEKCGQGMYVYCKTIPFGGCERDPRLGYNGKACAYDCAM